MDKKSNAPAGTGADKVMSSSATPALSSDAASVHKRRRHDLTVEAVIQLLAEKWPSTFAVHDFRRRPLKVGIFDDVLAAVDGAVGPAELGKALACYVGNPVYLSKLRTGRPRFGLDGNQSGQVTAEEASHAKLTRSMALSLQCRGDRS